VIALAPSRTATIALVGAPNTGKSSLFNRLTGLRQQIGNYPGVTVERRHGMLETARGRATLVDLPGCYSLRSRSPDEKLAADFLAGRLAGEEVPDLILCVVNSCDLGRHLFLPLQLAELQCPLIIALNFSDEAAEKGLLIDAGRLGEKFGAPVVPVSAREGTGIDNLVTAIEAVLQHPARPHLPEWPPAVLEGLRVLEDQLLEPPRRRADGLRLLFGQLSADANERVAVQAAQAAVARLGMAPGPAESMHLHRLAKKIASEVTTSRGTVARDVTRKIDRILTHRVAGPGIFALLMAVVFQTVYAGATPLMDGIEAAKATVQGGLANQLEEWPLLQSLLTDGMVEGVGAFLVFLPQILILFLFISLLEETGYMARAAFLMDRLFSWCGLSGKSFVPLLSCYACAIPGILATRTIEEPRSRLATILIAPLMSCSARLPVYVLLIGAFVAPVYGPWIAGLVLLLAHMLGLVVALPVAWLFNRWLFRTRPQVFVLEMPPYRFPSWRNVAWRVWESGREFVVKAGTVILALTIVIWALLSFPRDLVEAEAGAEAKQQLEAPAIENSWLGRIGRGAEPVFAPAGFDWRVTVGILASFSAREVVIPTLSILYQLDGDAEETAGSLRAAMREHRWETGPRAGQPVFTLPAVFALMVFFALCSQCAPTLAVITRESGLRWAVFAFGYLTALAWIGAILTFQGGTLLVSLL
jgi:ferrous iron transport protein B